MSSAFDKIGYDVNGKTGIPHRNKSCVCIAMYQPQTLIHKLAQAVPVDTSEILSRVLMRQRRLRPYCSLQSPHLSRDGTAAPIHGRRDGSDRGETSLHCRHIRAALRPPDLTFIALGSTFGLK